MAGKTAILNRLYSIRCGCLGITGRAFAVGPMLVAGTNRDSIYGRGPRQAQKTGPAKSGPALNAGPAGARTTRQLPFSACRLAVPAAGLGRQLNLHWAHRVCRTTDHGWVSSVRRSADGCAPHGRPLHGSPRDSMAAFVMFARARRSGFGSVRHDRRLFRNLGLDQLLDLLQVFLLFRRHQRDRLAGSARAAGAADAVHIIFRALGIS